MTARDRTVLIVVAILGAIAGSWLLVISPKRDQAAQLQTQIDTQRSSLSDAQAKLAQGEAARNAFRSSYGTLVRLGEAVPTDDDVPSLIYQIQSAAGRTGVDFLGLTLNPAGPGGAAPTTTPAAPPASSSSSTTPAAAAPAALPPGAGVGPAGFPIEPFTFTFTGNFFHLASFFGRLEHFVVAHNRHLAVSGRLLSLDAIDLGPGPAGFPQISATVSATTYLLPASEGLLAGATAAGPASTAAPQQASTTPATPSAPPAAAVTPVTGR